jgi:predicted RNA binding protein YcfA (HicA-like mRNA interferase family)
MALPKPIWDQLKATTVEEFISALKRDGFEPDPAGGGGGPLAFIKNVQGENIRVVLHYHPGKSWGPKFLKGLIESAGWNIRDLGRIGLIAKSEEGSVVATTLVPCECDLGIIEGGQPCPLCGGTSFREVPIQ